MTVYKFANKSIKVPPHGSYIRLYYPGTYPCLARVWHRNKTSSYKKLTKKRQIPYEGLVDAEGIFQWRDKSKNATQFTISLNSKGKKLIKWKLINT